nr:VWA domain-containing protein [Rhizobium sp. Q54]
MMAWQGFSRLVKDRSGNFGMMTAILLPVLIGAGGLALDVTNMLISKAELQDAADSAALAASTALAAGEAANEAAAEELARQFFLGQASNTMGEEAATALAGALDIDIKTTTTGNGKSFEVQVGSTYDLALSPLMGVLGYGTMNIATSGTSTSGTSVEQTALSMALVLDQSGSMNWDTTTVASKTCAKTKKNGKCKEWDITYVKKITALKTAAAALFDALDSADPDGKLTRTGAISYTHEVKGQTSPLMAWGTSAARTYVSGLPGNPAGGTDASGAMVIADEGVKKLADGSDTETTEHLTKNNTKVNRFIILMTDGEMTGNSDSWKENIDKKVRDACNSAKSHSIRIFTVAFMAPKKGKELLQYCATASADYYEPETMEQLVSDFSKIAQSAVKGRTLLTH